jgi:hypothetical protein
MFFVNKQVAEAYKKSNLYAGITKTIDKKGESSMTKVKLPKAAADALDLAFSLSNERKLTKVDMLYATKNKAWGEDFHALNLLDPLVMMDALVLGYEPELTQEQKAFRAYNLFSNTTLDEQEFWCYREGCRQMAKALGFDYHWLEPTAVGGKK